MFFPKPLHFVLTKGFQTAELAPVEYTDDWKAAYPRLKTRVVDERVFTLSAISDDKQSDSERLDRVQEYSHDTHNHPKVTFDDPHRYRYSGFGGYTIPIALKLELQEAVSLRHIHAGTLNEPIMHHFHSDQDQKKWRKNVRKVLPAAPLSDPAPPVRGITVETLSPTSADELLKTLQAQREKDDIGCRTALKAKRDFVNVEVAIEDVGWLPKSDQSKAMRPVFQNGGFQWREWEQETRDLLAAAQNT